MSTYAEEKRRRIEQFAQYLWLMGLRHRKVVHDGCFIIFEDSPPEDTDSSQLKESVAIKVDCAAEGGSAMGRGEPGENQANDWQGEEAQIRYIQFAFRQDCFY